MVTEKRKQVVKKRRDELDAAQSSPIINEAAIGPGGLANRDDGAIRKKARRSRI